MFIELRHIVQWLHSPRNARDPRVQFFATLKRSSSIDAASISVTKSNDVLIVEGRYSFPEINLSTLKKGRFETKSKTKDFKIILKQWDKETAQVDTGLPSIFQIPLEDAFIYWQFYVILLDENKLKKLETLIKE